MPEPQRNRAYSFSLGLIDTATGAWLVAPSIAAGDFQVALDNGAMAALSSLPVVAAGSRLVQVNLSAAEMNAARVDVYAHDAAGVWDDVLVHIQTTHTIGTDGRALLSFDAGQPVLDADMVALAGNATSPGVLDRSARTIVLVTVGSGSTTTSVVTSTLTPAASVAQQFAGRVLIFDASTPTLALRGHAVEILASTAAGVLTTSPLVSAPVSGDTAAIL